MKTQRAHLRSRSIKSKLQKIFLAWFVDDPACKRFRHRRSNIKENPSVVGQGKVQVGCCWTFVFFLVASYLIIRYGKKRTISILDHEGYDSGMQSKHQSVDKNKVHDPSFDSKQHFKPNPTSLNPSEWDLAFTVTPLINLKAWSKSFESCFFEQKLNSEVEIMFYANFYLEGKFIFHETLQESKRTYSKSMKVFSINFGKKADDYMHAEFQYDLATRLFFISINSEFNIQFRDLVTESTPIDVINSQDDNVWCNYDFDANQRYHVACKTIPIEDKLKHTFDSFEFEFIIQ